MLGVYIHMPFCERKCSYCAFSSFVSSEKEQEKYITSLISEIQHFSQKEKRNIDSISIGGGTPSLISVQLMEKLFNCLKENFIWSDNLEFSIEANPNSLTKEKLEFYKKSGVNRLSIGVQSLDDEKLKSIGRLHTSQQAIDVVKMAENYFDNISVDMLIGLPNMKKEDFLKEIELLSSFNIKHISAYMLQVEEGTPLAKIVKNNPFVLPDDDDSVGAYEEMACLLKKHGFNRYEVSNFAKDGFECKHNMKYWTGEDYIGFGLSAHSYIEGNRFANAKNFNDYYVGKLSMQEKLTDEQKIEEHIMLGLRCNQGVDKEYLSRLGYDITKNENLLNFIEKGIIKEDKNRLFLNPDYYGVNNYIIVHLLQ